MEKSMKVLFFMATRSFQFIKDSIESHSLFSINAEGLKLK